MKYMYESEPSPVAVLSSFVPGRRGFESRGRYFVLCFVVLRNT